MNPDEPLRVLIVDDDEDDYLLTRELLKDVAGTRYQVDWADSGDAALGIIARERHDAYLFDYRLGPMTGVDLLLELRERGRSIPVILLTGMQDFEIDLEAMEAGAADYLVKGQITPQLLERSLRYAVRHHAAMQALRESERKLAEANRFHTRLFNAIEQRDGEAAQSISIEAVQVSRENALKAWDSHQYGLNSE